MDTIAQTETPVSVPFHIRAQFLTVNEIHRLMDHELEKGGYLDHSGTPAEKNGHYQKYDLLAAELHRRDAKKAAREAKRTAKMETMARAWHAQKGAPS